MGRQFGTVQAGANVHTYAGATVDSYGDQCDELSSHTWSIDGPANGAVPGGHGPPGTGVPTPAGPKHDGACASPRLRSSAGSRSVRRPPATVRSPPARHRPTARRRLGPALSNERVARSPPCKRRVVVGTVRSWTFRRARGPACNWGRRSPVATATRCGRQRSTARLSPYDGYAAARRRCSGRSIS